MYRDEVQRLLEFSESNLLTTLKYNSFIYKKLVNAKEFIKLTFNNMGLVHLCTRFFWDESFYLNMEIQ